MQNNQNQLVKCETCKHQIDLEDAQKIVFERRDLSTKRIYFCPQDKVSYSRIKQHKCFRRDGSRAYTYSKEMDVHKDGTPYGFVKREACHLQAIEEGDRVRNKFKKSCGDKFAESIIYILAFVGFTGMFYSLFY